MLVAGLLIYILLTGRPQTVHTRDSHSRPPTEPLLRGFIGGGHQGGNWVPFGSSLEDPCL